jgi:VWFA-related protein
MTVRSVAAIGLLALTTTAVVAQSPSERRQFRAGVELMQLDVSVLDDKRQPVRGLTAADFTVLEDGVPRPIKAFTPIELDTRAPSGGPVWAGDVVPDVTTNRVGEQDGRLVVILMDRSVPAHQPTITARQVATASIDALGPHDLAAVVSTNNGAVQNFTSDRARLRRALHASDPSAGVSKEAEAVMAGVGIVLDPLADGRCLCGLCVMETITRVADAVRDTPRRRKTLLFIGSSVIWQASRPVAEAGEDVGCEMRLKDARNAMFAAVDRANLTIHSIDPQGLVNAGPQTQAFTRGGFDGGPSARLRQQQIDTKNVMTGRQSLEVLPERTGGRTIVGRNNPADAVLEIIRESEAYYVIAVEPRDPQRPDRPKAIEVKVARKGVRAYAQRQFAATAIANAGAAIAPPAPQGEAITRLLPSAARPLAIGVAAFASPDSAKAIVNVNIDARAFARSDGAPTPLDITVLAVDPWGRSVASARQTSTVAISRFAPGRQAAAPDVTIESRLELPRGDYAVRVAVSDPAGGAVASVFADVTVPAFESAPLSLSDVAIEASGAASARPSPTTRRTFRRGETVRAVLQIYQGTRRRDAIVPVTMRVQIVDAKGSAVRDQTLPFTATMFTNRRADCLITLPLANLAAGDYLLKLDAAADRQTAARAVRFAVE